MTRGGWWSKPDHAGRKVRWYFAAEESLMGRERLRAFARRRSRPIKDSSAAKYQRTFRPAWSGFDHHPPRVIAHLRLGIQELSAILRFLLRSADRNAVV